MIRPPPGSTLFPHTTLFRSSATTPYAGGTCTQSGGTATCNWASIPAGSSYYAVITVTPTAGGALTLSASVSGTQSDPNSANNSASKAATVGSGGALSAPPIANPPAPPHPRPRHNP